MKGEVEKIWRNRTTDGREYAVISVGGEKYSLWDENYFDQLREGQAIEFDFRESGDFKNITKIYEQPEKEPLRETDYNQRKLEKIVKMSCLRSASEVLSGSRVSPKKKADITIELARKFEKYINQDDPLYDILRRDGDVQPEDKERSNPESL